ncbi:fibrillin-1-like [Apis dorsata]|uniref:fibrillin-1-like n=1 Tax=Apis dorsata TaxID=7462 RepID=UPI0003DF7405|nr:fibrillin-1-like [Apis dorsata]
MTRFTDLRMIFFLLLIIQLEKFFLRKQGILFSEARMEEQFEKCCGLGTSWALEGLRCEKFTGPVSGVPTVEQGLCLEAVDICCVRAYHEQQCKKGKLDAHVGLACVSGSKSKRLGPGDYHRDCCEACKLGILTGSMGQGCAFKKFTFGNPWDPAFLECCYEASPSTTTIFTTNLTNATSSSEITNSESTSISSYSSSSSLSTQTTLASSTSFSPSIPTPPLDDICQLMKGLLCSDICVPTPGSYYCKCREGFTLLEDGKTCRQDLPTDRCKSSNPCEQRCTDNGVAVTCSCNPGYILADDKHSCLLKPSEIKTTTILEDNDFSLLCPAGYRYNATNQVCDDVNECIERRICPDYCENTIGSYICTSKNLKIDPYEDCPPGYQWESITGLCSDIDECLILSKPCPGIKNVCVNTQGSFSCLEIKGIKSCPAGFKFNNFSQQCEDVDECAEKIHSCLEDMEKCRNTEGAYECDIKCNEGFIYSVNLGICIDMDECLGSNNPCLDPNTTCKNILGGYECLSLNRSIVSIDEQTEPSICSAGYKPMNDSNNACIDVDECKEQLHSCEINEQCVNDIGSYRCEPLNHEITNLNGKDKDHHNYLYERNGHKSYIQRYNITGYKSQISNSPALNQTMICNEGFIFDQHTLNCIDIDECNNNLVNCKIDEKCINFNGGYKCSPICPSGFQYNDTYYSSRNEPFCRDINECALGLHSCNVSTHYCVNTNGSYSCKEFATTISSPRISKQLNSKKNNIMQNTNHYLFLEPCKKGYIRDVKSRECVDIDECASIRACQEHEMCHNMPGDFECTPLCTTGWYFNTVTKGCQDVNECLLGRHDCPENTHKCVNTNGSFFCELVPPCSNGYKRSFFNDSCVDIDECEENLHSCRLELHQYCVNRNGTFECLTRLPSCSIGYEYSLATRRCEDIDECVTDQHTCDSRLFEKCINLPGTYRCERPASIRQYQRQKPACPSGYRYHLRLKKCTDIDECAEGLDSCEGEVCYNQPGGYSCAKLPKPRTRKPLTTALPLPTNKKCIPGMKLVNNRCIDIDECREIEDACSSNEECINTVGSYMCECKIGFQRENLTQACVDINECQTQV